MNQAELQQSIQRVTSQFMSRLGEAVDEVLAGSPDLPIVKEVERQALLYDSSVLDIATGPVTEANLLDLVVFAELCADALERHWIPNVFGAAGEPLAGCFRQLRANAHEVAVRMLDAGQERELYAMVARWKERNPDRVRVADVRLLDVASVAGHIADAQTQAARGLLGSVKSATQAADQALLLGDRALFFAQRLPFLVRGHVRLVSQDVVEDTMMRLPLRIDAVLDPVQAKVDGMVRRWILYLVGAGGALTVLFWGGYYVARLLLERP